MSVLRRLLPHHPMEWLCLALTLIILASLPLFLYRRHTERVKLQAVNLSLKDSRAQESTSVSISKNTTSRRTTPTTPKSSSTPSSAATTETSVAPTPAPTATPTPAPTQAPTAAPEPTVDTPPSEDSPATSEGETVMDLVDRRATSTEDIPLLPIPDVNTMKQEVLLMINELRAAEGQAPLAWDATLQQIADIRAQELAVHYEANHAALTHIRPDGSSALTWIANTFGSKYAGGENISWYDNVRGTRSRHIYRSFEASPDHHSIMVDPEFTICAVGIYQDLNHSNPNNSNENESGCVFVSINFGY